MIIPCTIKLELSHKFHKWKKNQSFTQMNGLNTLIHRHSHSQMIIASTTNELITTLHYYITRFEKRKIFKHGKKIDAQEFTQQISGQSTKSYQRQVNW